MQKFFIFVSFFLSLGAMDLEENERHIKRLNAKYPHTIRRNKSTEGIIEIVGRWCCKPSNCYEECPNCTLPLTGSLFSAMMIDANNGGGQFPSATACVTAAWFSAAGLFICCTGRKVQKRS